MNILIFVMTILMLLSVTTYGRLQSVRHRQVAAPLLRQAMEARQRESADDLVCQLYDSFQIPQEKEEELSNEPKNERCPASAKLNIKLFFDASLREKDGQLFEEYGWIFKSLMRELYSRHPLFREIEGKRPDYLDAILYAIIVATANLDVKIDQIQYLANLSLGDETLDFAFTKMLQGYIVEGQPQAGYPSLFNFITLKGDKIRIFLASPELLKIIFSDPFVVQQIREERYQLWKEVKANKGAKEQATRQFGDHFRAARNPNISEDLLDFTISTTYPGKPK